MNQNSVKKALHAILRPIVQGLIIFAVFGLGLYAYAITYPPAPGPASGVVGMFVGFSPNGYDNTVTSYQALNDKCNSYTDYISHSVVANSTAHACSSAEMMNTYNNQPSAINGATGAGIINNGPPGYIVFANDCNGWTVRTATYLSTNAYGAVWDFGKDAASLQRCDSLAGDPVTFKVACCQ